MIFRGIYDTLDQSSLSHYCPTNSKPRHSRASGNPVVSIEILDSRLRGNDNSGISSIAGFMSTASAIQRSDFNILAGPLFSKGFVGQQ